MGTGAIHRPCKHASACDEKFASSQPSGHLDFSTHVWAPQVLHACTQGAFKRRGEDESLVRDQRVPLNREEPCTLPCCTGKGLSFPSPVVLPGRKLCTLSSDQQIYVHFRYCYCDTESAAPIQQPGEARLTTNTDTRGTNMQAAHRSFRGKLLQTQRLVALGQPKCRVVHLISNVRLRQR